MTCKRGRLDAGLFALALFHQLHFVAVLFGPAHVHAHQHLGPVLRLGAAGAGVQFDVAVVAIGLARTAGFRFPAAWLPRPRRAGRPSPRPTIAASPSASASSISSSASATSVSSLRTPSMAEAIWLRSRISFCAAAASFHSAGSSARLFSSARRASATSQSKMPPQQRDGLLDLFVQGVGFGGHGADHAHAKGRVNTGRPCCYQPRHARSAGAAGVPSADGALARPIPSGAGGAGNLVRP